MWHYFLTTIELADLLAVPGRVDARNFLIGTLIQNRINYGDIIDLAQRRLVGGLYVPADKCLHNICVNNDLICHILANPDAKYLLFNTAGIFGVNGILVPGGIAKITVTANGCNGSTTTNFNNVTVSASPTRYNLFAPTSICSGATAMVRLSGSQSGVSYQLYKNNSPEGSPVQGDGSFIDWTGMTQGTYRVMATGPNCPAIEMLDQKTIGTTSPGNVYITASRSPLLCQGESITLTANGGSNYSWASSNGGVPSGSPITVAPLTTTTYTLSGNVRRN